MTISTIVPFKGDKAGKSRLTNLTRDQRSALVRQLLLHVVGTIMDSNVETEILVVSPMPPDPSVERRLREMSNFTWLDDEGRELNRALKFAVDHAIQGSASAVLIIPADLPLIQSTDIEALTRRLPTYGGVVVPAKDGGTGALGLRPPALVDPQFGKDSASRHVSALVSSGGEAILYPNDAFAFDIDIPGDFEAFQELSALNVC